MKIEDYVPPQLLDNVGGAFDLALLTILRSGERFFRKPIHFDRDLYRQQLEFYFDNGFVDDPVSFFSFPDNPPVCKIESERPFFDGKQTVMTYSSGYRVKNPLLEYFFKKDKLQANQKGYLFHWRHGDTGRPTVVCLHGFALGKPAQAMNMFRIKKLYKMGVDVALFITPFHWRRAPANRLSGLYYLIPENAAVTCENFGQSMYDLYGCLLLLKERGAGRLGLIGASLGGYHSSLFASLSDLAEFATLVVPGVDFLEQMEKHNYAMDPPPDSEMADKIRKIWMIHSPFSHKLKIPEKDILIIAARGDGFCLHKYVRKLSDHWNNPQHHYLAGGHWLFFNRNSRGAAWYNFLIEKGFAD